MVAIIVDHLSFFPNGLDWWGMRGGLFVTAAEGFFIMSGIVLGIVRGAKYIDRPMKEVTNLLLKRGFQLYLTVAVLAIIFTLIGWAYMHAGIGGIKPGIFPADTSIWQVILSSFTLQYYYGWADYLRLYALFLFASPLVFWLLRKGLWYLALAGSFAVWLLFPLLVGDGGYSAAEYWQPVSWQLLFFMGVIIGFNWNFFLDTWNGFSDRVRRIISVSLVSTAVITLVISVLFMLSTMGYNTGPFTSDLRHIIFSNFFNKESLPLTRILLAMIWFWAGFWVFKRFEKPIKKAIGWLLLPFGTNSLYVYTLHAFAVFFVHIHISRGSLLWNFIVTAGVILLIRLCVHYKVLMKIIPR